jgi:hypothetical protein
MLETGQATANRAVSMPKEGLMTMTVDTKRVGGRRAVRFRSFDELLAEAESLAAGPTESLGNWSLGQALKHLALSMDLSIDGGDFDVHWLIRGFIRTFLRRRLIHVRMSPGVRLPPPMAEQLVPGETSVEEGLSELQRAVERLRRDSRRRPHPLLGKMSLAEWEQFHLRHAELHLSYILPG